MKTFAPLAVLLASAALAAETGFQIKVTGVPAGTTEVVAVIDAAAAPPAGYDEPPPPAPVAPAAPAIDVAAVAAAGAAPAAADPQAQRRRRGGAGRGNAVLSLPAVRVAVPTNGATSVTLNAATAANDKFQVRVVAIKGAGASPVVLAGGRVAQAAAEPGKLTPLEIALTAPRLTLSPDNPAVVAPGATYTLAGKITDAANSLGAKNRMRVWLSAGTPPRENFAGAQVSTIDVTTEGNDVSFSFTLTAPKEPTKLYFQFGELPADFARADGKQAPLLVLPDLGPGAAPLELRVEPKKVAAAK